MVDIRKTEHQKLADGSEYLAVTIADDLADGRIRDLIRSVDIPELLPFFIVNLKDKRQGRSLTGSWTRPMSTGTRQKTACPLT